MLCLLVGDDSGCKAELEADCSLKCTSGPHGSCRTEGHAHCRHLNPEVSGRNHQRSSQYQIVENLRFKEQATCFILGPNLAGIASLILCSQDAHLTGILKRNEFADGQCTGCLECTPDIWASKATSVDSQLGAARGLGRRGLDQRLQQNMELFPPKAVPTAVGHEEQEDRPVHKMRLS